MLASITNLWKYYTETICSNDQFKIGYVTVNALNLFEYLLIVHLLLFIDVFERPKFLLRYKIDSTAKLNWDKYMKCVPRLLTNLVFVHLPETYVFVKILNWRGCLSSTETIPGILEVS